MSTDQISYPNDLKGIGSSGNRDNTPSPLPKNSQSCPKTKGNRRVVGQSHAAWETLTNAMKHLRDTYGQKSADDVVNMPQGDWDAYALMVDTRALLRIESAR